jgi:hypothetical protein
MLIQFSIIQKRHHSVVEMELGIGAGGGPQAELPSAVIDDGNDVWEDMEEDEDKTCEDDADDDYDMEDIDDAALSKITNFAYKTDNNVSHFSTL